MGIWGKSILLVGIFGIILLSPGMLNLPGGLLTIPTAEAQLSSFYIPLGEDDSDESSESSGSVDSSGID